MATGALALAALASPLLAGVAYADDREKLIANGRTSLQQLEASDARAARLAPKARAILVFPSVIKAGFVFGGAAE